MKIKANTIKKIIACITVYSLLFSIHLPQAYAQEVNPGFDPSKLIDDKVFADTKTFGSADGIQKFLESKGSVLANTTPDFLAKLKEPIVTMLKQGLDDPQPNLPRLRTAAELIWDSATSAGINPQVIIVKLQKEQGLITNHKSDTPEQLQRALDFSLGFACPDSTGCSQNNVFKGFYSQMFGNFDAEGNRYLGATKSLVKSFTTPGGRGPVVNGRPAKVGEVVMIDNTQGPPYNAPPQQQVLMSNAATAALYRYTPHVFNGNYNFWKYFNEWFRYANGTIIKLSGDSNTYIIQNGYRMSVPAFVATARKLDLTNSITVSPTEVDSYPQGKIYGPADNTVVKLASGGDKFVFKDNVKRRVTDFVLKQRGLDTQVPLDVAPQDLALFEQGDVLTPTDGTVLKGATTPAIYLVENGGLKLFSAFTFKQLKAAAKVQTIPDGEIELYPKSGFVAPQSGTLVRAAGDKAVFLITDGFKHPISGEVFKNVGYKIANIVELSKEEVAGLTVGSFATPKERSVFQAGSKGPVYLFKDGQKHLVSSFVGKQRKITPDFVVSAGEAAEWFDGIPIPPSNGTIVKGDKSQAVYLVDKAQLRPLTANAFKKRKIKTSQIKVLPQAEVDEYAKGETLDK